MKVYQRDIVEVNFLFPDGKFKPHMAVVVSNDELNENEEFFYLAMISSKNYNILIFQTEKLNLSADSTASRENMLLPILAQRSHLR